MSAFATAAARTGGQAATECVLDAAFRDVPTAGLLWAALPFFEASDLALVLAEHLRLHFSGAQGEGAVEIVDEVDRYRLVLSPCGSGGALRRRLGVDSKPAVANRCRQPSNSSWNQTDVPYYCMHCAHNEMHSIDLMGFPRWVTEYTGDPDKPCGWTIYKDPTGIPQSYFTRLGRTREPSKFRHTGALAGSSKALGTLVGLIVRRTVGW